MIEPMEPKLFSPCDNSKGRILILANEIYPQICVGGLGMFVAGISKGLSKNGWEVAVFTPQNQKWVYLPHCSLQNQVRSRRLASEALVWCQSHAWMPTWVWLQDLEGVFQMDVWEKKARIIWTIHNPISAKGEWGYYYDEPEPKGDNEPIDWGDDFFDFLGLIESGVKSADLITTVSPTYARDLSKIPPFSKTGKVLGIGNGIDKEEWNPLKDPFLSYQLKDNWREFKRINKKNLQEIFRLPQKEIPVYAFISRLMPQKGIDLMIQVLPSFLAKNETQLVVVGRGFKKYHRFFENLKTKFPSQVGLCLEANFILPHQVFAGADFLLLPSISEPFGIVVAESRQYGTIPIVRKVGGLADQVKDGIDGFSFQEKSNEALMAKLYQSSWFWQTNQQLEMSLSGQRLTKDWSEVVKEYEPYLLKSNQKGNPSYRGVKKTLFPG